MPSQDPAANAKIVGTVGYCMSGHYAVNAATHFPDRVKAAASIYGTQLVTDEPDSPHLAASKTKAELYFGCAETDVYAPQEIIDKIAASHEGRQRRSRDLSRHPSRLRVPEAADLPPRRRRTALGTAAGALSPQPFGIDLGHDAVSDHRLSRVRPDRHCDRADRDPLVCAGLYRRHRAGMDLRARADQERQAVGRTGADHAAATRRFHPVGHARHHPRRPHRLCAVLQSAVLHAASRGDPGAVEGRHVVSRRFPRLRRRGDVVLPEERPSDPVARRYHHRGRPDRAVSRPPRQFHQQRIMGPAGRPQPALGDGVSQWRPAAAPSEPAL